MSRFRISTPTAHLVVAGVAGLSVTVLEFAAVRFQAPSFGQSNYVWANVIGVILLALALGYWFGGRLADRSTSARPLYFAYVLASFYVVGIAFLGGALADWLVPREVGNARILPLAFTGSLVATVSLFGPPTLVLGMTSPFLVRLDDTPGHSGRVAGRIFAVGTIGSLIGCYLGPLWLFQTVGSRVTILLCAAALAALGLAGLVLGTGRSKSPVGGAAGGIALLLALGLSVYALVKDLDLRHHEGQVAEVESAYQTIRVVQEKAKLLPPGRYPLYGKAEPIPTRFLRHDEDAESYQSVWLPEPGDTEKYLTGGRYYEHLALGAWFARKRALDTLRVLVIGYAGGSLHRVLDRTVPRYTKLDVLGVEIDPAVVDVARKWLDLKSLEGEGLEVLTDEDGRTVVNALPADRRFDLIFVDAYTRATYVPFQVATLEFFERLAKHLAPEGWIGLNVHAAGGLRGRLVNTIATTVAKAEGLGDAWLTPNPLFPGSVVVWVSAPAMGAPRVRTPGPTHPGLRTAAFALERLTVRHVPERDGGHVLTDDLSDVDRLTDADLVGP